MWVSQLQVEGAFIQLITANRITSLDSVNSKEFPLNHLSCCREQRTLLRLIPRARLFYVSKGRSGVTVKACIRHLRVEIRRVKYWGIAHDLSAKCARTLLPSLNVLTKSNPQQTHAKLCIYLEVFFQELPLGNSPSPGPAASPFFRIERLQQEPVCISPPAAAYFFFPSWFYCRARFSFPIPQKISQQTSSEGEKNDAFVMDGAPRRMRAVDLIEFATAALYTSEGQPMRAHTLHRLLLLHPATTTATLVCPQQGSRIDVFASQKNQMKTFNQKFSQTEVGLCLYSLIQ